MVFDATHSVQLPGGGGNASGGQPSSSSRWPGGGRVGVEGVFVEVHEAPEQALSDGANALRLDKLPALWRKLQRIWSAARQNSIEVIV